MRKFFFFAVAAIISLSAAAQTTSKTIISEFSSREIAEGIEGFYAMATMEPGYAYRTVDSFVSVVSHYDNELKAQCVKVRAVKGNKMLVISYFGKIGQDGAADLARYGISQMLTANEVIFDLGNGNKLVLNAGAAAEGKVKAVSAAGFTEVEYRAYWHQPKRVE